MGRTRNLSLAWPLLLPLLLGAGGCNLSSPGASPPPGCGLVEDSFKGVECNYRRGLFRTLMTDPDGDGWPAPSRETTVRVGYEWEVLPGVVFRDLDATNEPTFYSRGGEGGYGTALRYYRLPGFPEARFMIGRAFPPHAEAICDVRSLPPYAPEEKCYTATRDIGGPEDPDFLTRWGMHVHVRYGMGGGHVVAPGGEVRLSAEVYPVLQGKDGRTDTFMELVWQIEAPTADDPFPEEWRYVFRDPHLHPRLWQGPYYALDDLYQALVRYRGPDWGKTYGASLRYRYHLLEGDQVRLEILDWDMDIGTTLATDFRRLRGYDAHPMSRGYFNRVPNWLIYGTGGLEPLPPRQGVLAEALKPENLYAPASDDFYVFQEAWGHVTPPAPVCLRRGLYNVYSLVGPYQPRAEPFEPYMSRPTTTPQEYGAGLAQPTVNYTHHLVTTVGREARVVGYHVTPNLAPTLEANGGGLRDRMPRAIPMLPLDAPNPFVALGRGVERYAVFYRSTARFGWEPGPGHTPYEDLWKVVWSDVRLAGTPESPDCAVEAIGFHVFSPEESRALDRALGLEEVETYDRFGYDRPYGKDGGVGTPDNRRGPMLTALYAPPGLFWHPTYFLTRVEPGEVRVPLLPPGW